MAKDKLYRVTATLPNGQRKYYSGRTKKEAEEKRSRDRLLIAKGYTPWENPKFKEFAEAWFTTYRKKNLHPRTIETTRGILDRHLLPDLGDMHLQDIRPLHIENLIADNAHLSHSTQKKIIQLARTIMENAVDNGLLERNPVLAKIKPITPMPDEVTPLTDEQCEILLTTMKGTRVYPFLMVLRFCGLRKGEALGLMWKDIDFENNEIHVNRSIVYTLENKRGYINDDMKSVKAHRTVPMIPQLAAVLKEEQRKSKSLYVFSMQDGSFLSESSFRRMWDLIDYRTAGGKGSTKADRPIDFHVHPHLLRHTCLTGWFRAGLDIKEVQYLAGHATADITLDVYVHYVRREQEAETRGKVIATELKFAVG